MPNFPLCVLLAVLAVFQASSAIALDRTWIGGNVDWVDAGVSANWTPADEPDPDDTAIFNTANSVDLGTGNSILALTLSGGIDLFTNGQDLAVDGLVQLSGTGTNLFVGGAASELNADHVTINSGGTLELAGGTLVIDEESGTGLLDLNAGGTFAGHGILTFADIPFVPTTLLINDGTLTALSRGLTIFSPPPIGTLTINDSSVGGRIDLDGAGTAGVVNVNQNQTLDINVPLSDNFAGTLNLFQNATFDLSTGWTLDGGAINVNNGFVAASPPFPSVPAGVSIIDGGALTQTGGTITVTDTDGTLRFDAPFNMNGGTLTNHGLVIFNNNATIAAGANFTMPTTSSSLTVEAGRHVTINQPNFDLDGGNSLTNVITVNTDGFLEIDTTDYDPDQVTNAFEGTINLDGGLNGPAVMSVVTSSATFVMDGTLNMSTGAAAAAAWLGETLDIGNDSGAGDAQLHANGSGTASFNASVDFNSDAVVTIAAGTRLIFTSTSTVNFDTVNGLNQANISGSGELNFSGPVNVREAVTLNMVGGTVLLDGSDLGGDLISVHAPLTINAATMDGFGISNNVGGPNTLDIDARSAGTTGKLTVNLDDPNDEWTLNAAGVMNLSATNPGGAVVLAGSDVNVNGTLNVLGSVSVTARLDLGGPINLPAGSGLTLAGGTATDPNTIAGSTVSGFGTFRVSSNHTLIGFGSLENVAAPGTAKLLADNGTLIVNGLLGDIGTIGTADADGILNVVNNWNTGFVNSVVLNGGEIKGGTLSITGGNGIVGHGLVSSRIVNNGKITASNGTLVVQTVANDNDWDGVILAVPGDLIADGGTLELRDTATFDFFTLVTATNGGRVFANGFALDFKPGSSINLTSGSYESTQSTDIGGTVTVAAGSDATIGVQGNGLLIFEATSNTTLTGNLRLVSNNARINTGATFNGTGALIIPVGSQLAAGANANINVLLDNQGILRPTGDDLVGRIDVRDYQQSSTGELFVELTGTGLNEFDRLVVNGAALLDGSLNVDLDGGFVPVLGQAFNIVSATGGLTGQFDSVIQPVGIPAGLIMDVIYSSTIAQLKVLPIGDFNLDGSFTCTDVDSLVAQIASGIDLPDFDMNGDALVDNADLTLWLARAGAANLSSGNPYLPGDATLDGVVDGSDFLAWNSHKFTSTTDWCGGNFNADSGVDGSDFLIWNSHKFTSSASLTAVPEPELATAALFGIAITMMLRPQTRTSIFQTGAARQ